MPFGWTHSAGHYPLVALGEDLGTEWVFTLDRGFTIYRLRGKGRFHVLP
jgi:hypothetical protein